MPFFLIQTIYWGSLATWFGGAVFLLLAVPVLMRVTRDQDPTLPKVLSVNLDGDHATLLTMEVFSGLLRNLITVGGGCAAVVALCMVGHAALLDRGGSRGVELIVRAGLLLLGIGVMLQLWRSTQPRLATSLRDYVEHADDPEKSRTHREAIVRGYRDAVTTLGVLTCALGGLILFSANMGQSMLRLVQE